MHPITDGTLCIPRITLVIARFAAQRRGRRESLAVVLVRPSLAPPELRPTPGAAPSGHGALPFQRSLWGGLVATREMSSVSVAAATSATAASNAAWFTGRDGSCR